ncbi:MAG: polyphosphate polymerase domain-containing protein [Eubacteriales bacterium]|nr:polyphosphate polymerase domain-containing protein [Clostridiales bacterium]MDD7772937.1 polyphosphate polymerase domain-containing protein [Eubacteriales bacterium]MDY3942600.1 polyphosphate polymerase domain-containing protein [Eubacteriales bacterium]
MESPKPRHEYKFPLSGADTVWLERRLRQVFPCDPHADPVTGGYAIRSLYFDDWHDRALWEKLDGVDPRSKFRIRIYNGSDRYIVLEKKHKCGALTKKEQSVLTRAECDRLLSGDICFLQEGDAVRQSLYHAMEKNGMRGKTLVEYDRSAFVYEPGNVRITIDKNIRSGLYDTALFGKPILVPANTEHVLEVKFDAYLPELVRLTLSPLDVCRFSLSKYAVCRRFG